MNGRIKQAVVGLLMFSCVSGVAASVTLSQMHGATRVRRAVQSQPKAAPKAAVRVASQTSENVAPTAVATTAVATERVTEKEAVTLSAVARTHRVRLVNGTVSGAIQAIAGDAVRNLTDVRVSFMRNGSAVAQVSPGTDGVFHASVPPGLYTVVAYGPSGYAAYGVHVADPDVAVRSASFDSQLSLQIQTLAVPSGDVKTAFRLIRAGLKSSSALPRMTQSDPEPTLPEVPVDNAPPQTTIQHHMVNLEADGSLLGKMTRLDKVTGNLLRINAVNAFLVQNGQVLHQTTVGQDGSLKFSAVNPGVYSFVTAGVEGFSAFGVVVAPPMQTAAAGQVRPVSFNQGGGGPLTGTLGFPEDGPPPGPPEETPPEAPPEDPAGAGAGFGGGGAGGGIGGGGAGGGGLGLGGLLGLAGLGLGAAALADDDDNNNAVSPAGP
jgi:hypothetical protein